MSVLWFKRDSALIANVRMKFRFLWVCLASFLNFKQLVSFLLVKFQVPRSQIELKHVLSNFSSASFKMDAGVHVEMPKSNDERTSLIPKSSSRRVVYATLISIWGTFSFGYSLGYSSPASYDLQSANASDAVRLSSSQQSWFSVSVTMNEFKRKLNIMTVYGIIYSIIIYYLLILISYIIYSLMPLARHAWSFPAGNRFSRFHHDVVYRVTDL